MTAATALPTLDEWMTMRARITEMIGETSATTLLSLLPSPVEGGLVTNNRIDLMEAGLRGEIGATNNRIDLMEAGLRGEIGATNNRIDLMEAGLRGELQTEIAGLRGEIRTDIAELRGELRSEISSVRTEIADLRGDLRTEIARSASETVRSMRSMFLQLVGVMVSLGGITLAVAKLL